MHVMNMAGPEHMSLHKKGKGIRNIYLNQDTLVGNMVFPRYAQDASKVVEGKAV